MTDISGQKDFVSRVRAILTSPKTEWPVIAAEPATVGGIYTKYVVILAAIPVIAGFISNSILGASAFGVSYRVPMMTGLTSAIVTYLLYLASVFIMALIIDALAPTFGGTKNQVQAVKTAAYSATAAWVASIFGIVPILGWLIAIAGSLYSLYLFYVGLPVTMKSPTDRTLGYTVVVIICAIVVWLVIGLISAAAIGGAAMRGGFGALGGGNETVQFDPDSPLGQLEAWGDRMEQAGQNMEAAQQSGDADAQQQAVNDLFGTLLGNDGSVEALAPEAIREFVPETLLGLARTEVSSERQGMMGIQISTARATYSDGARTLDLEIMDAGGAAGLMSAASWAGIEEERQTETGYERSYREGGRMIHEMWDNQSKSGEYGVLLGNRFMVRVSGEASDIGELKDAASMVDLSALESRAT